MVAVPSIGRATQVTPRRGAPEADATRDLYERYARQIHAYCLHQLGSREEAEDAVQSTFLNAFRGLKRGIDPEFESAWLYKIAENVCLTRQRSSYRRRRVESPGDLDAMQDMLPSHEPDNDQLIRLPEALEEMPEQQRRALLLREWQGLSYREIAGELGLSQSAVETLLFRARRSLANALADDSKPRKSSLQKLRTGGDAGSLIALIKTVAFSGGVKVAATVATVAATSIVVATPAARHSADQAFAPVPGPHPTTQSVAARVHRSLLFHSSPVAVLAVTRPRPRSGKLIAAASRAAYAAGLLGARGSDASLRSGAGPGTSGGRATLVPVPTASTPAPPSPRPAADDPPVPAPPVIDSPAPVPTETATPPVSTPSGTGSVAQSPAPVPAPVKDTSKGPQSETPVVVATPLTVQVDAKAAREAEKDAKKAAKGAAGHGKKSDASIVIPPAPAPGPPPTILPPAAVVPTPAPADVQLVAAPAPADSSAAGTTPAPPVATTPPTAVTSDPGNSDHGDKSDRGVHAGHRK